MTVNKKNKKRKEPTLFPGYLMGQRVQNIQHGACIVGDLFERITEVTLSSSRSYTDSTQSLCPDLINDSSNTLIESKAFGCKSHRDVRALIEVRQLNNYVQLMDTYDVWYTFWNYAKNFTIVKKKTVIEDLVVKSAQTIQYCCVLDVSIMRALFTQINNLDGVGFRHCRLFFIGREVIERDYMVLSGRVFKEVQSDALGFLGRVGLNPDNYELSIKTRRIQFEYDSVILRTNTFKIYKLLPKIPF